MTTLRYSFIFKGLSTLALIVMSILPVSTYAFDVVTFAQFKVLPCIHPTANIDTATAEIDKPTAMLDDVLVTRMKVFYDGWIRKNSSLFDIQYRPGQSPLVRVKMLEDTALTGVSSSCRYTTGWQDSD